MLGKYKTRIILGHLPTDQAVNDRMPPWIGVGESWKSTNGGQYQDDNRNALKLEADGRFTITKQNGRTIWDSMYTEVPAMSTRPRPGAYELKLMENGNLVLQRIEVLSSGEEPFVIWQSVTSKHVCSGLKATKVTFERGELKVMAADTLLWSSGTRDSCDTRASDKEAPCRAKAKYFGYGKHAVHPKTGNDVDVPVCMQHGCATLFKEKNDVDKIRAVYPYPMLDTFGLMPNKNSQGQSQWEPGEGAPTGSTRRLGTYDDFRIRLGKALPVSCE